MSDILPNGKLIKPGDKFNKLTAVSYCNGKWTCRCDCGKTTIPILTHRLVANKVLSCGCARDLAAKENVKKCIKLCKDPRMASARRRWKGYYDGDEFTITFEDWLELTQKNCHYCNGEPRNIINAFSKKDGAAAESIKNGDYIHNGIDRIDSLGKHSIDNVVTCCIICNRAKLNRPVQDFLNHLKNLRSSFDFSEPPILDLPTGYLLTSVKIAYRQYNEMPDKLSLQEFYSYSQAPCAYCGVEKNNCTNVYLTDKKSSQKAKDNAYFYYNGLDRVDNSRRHERNNVVPCCKWCNFAKSNLSIEEFNEWTVRAAQYQNKGKQ